MALVIKTNTIKKTAASDYDASTSVVDSSWETIDPNPDIHALFLEFNDKYFHCALAGCEVRWSPRMTYCAGLCVYEGRGGLCSIRLSQPLLKFRPRKDLVETLLHEMIHAYLFVTDGDRDRESHGPQFQSHMNRINTATGANITIYHNYNAEVDYHRQHWWRCDGPCQNRPPYFGYVKRSMNRAPGPNDTWYSEHERTCGGKFDKIKEPEKSSKQKEKNSCDDKKEKKKRPKDGAEDSRFPGTGHVLGAGGGKMRRLEEYFPKVEKGEETREDTASTSKTVQCPVCHKSVESSRVNCHLDECLTRTTLKDETEYSV